MPPGAEIPHIHTNTFTPTGKQANSYPAVIVLFIVLQVEQKETKVFIATFKTDDDWSFNPCGQKYMDTSIYSLL